MGAGAQARRERAHSAKRRCCCRHCSCARDHAILANLPFITVAVRGRRRVVRPHGLRGRRPVVDLR